MGKREMNIRKATKKDIAKINEIYSEGILQELKLQYPDKSAKDIQNYADDEIKEHKKTIKHNLLDKNQYWIILEEDNLVIGFGSAYIKGNKGVTESIYVAKEFQKKGYGSLILKELISWIKSRKVKHIETNLLTNNIPSLKLHEKFGFKPYLLRMRLR